MGQIHKLKKRVGELQTALAGRSDQVKRLNDHIRELNKGHEKTRTELRSARDELAGLKNAKKRVEG